MVTTQDKKVLQFNHLAILSSGGFESYQYILSSIVNIFELDFIIQFFLLYKIIKNVHQKFFFIKNYAHTSHNNEHLICCLNSVCVCVFLGGEKLVLKTYL